jgi:hypothetical protein
MRGAAEEILALTMAKAVVAAYRLGTSEANVAERRVVVLEARRKRLARTFLRQNRNSNILSSILFPFYPSFYIYTRANDVQKVPRSSTPENE